MGLVRQEYWSGLPFPSPEYFLNPGIEPGSPALEADALTSAVQREAVQEAWEELLHLQGQEGQPWEDIPHPGKE